MKKLLAVFALSSFLISCATTVDMKKLGPDELAYVEAVQAAPVSFQVPKAKAEEAWGRGHNFINLYSGMKVQSSTDYHVSTFNPAVSETGTIGYSMNKLVQGDNVQFTVSCMNKPLNFKYTKSVCKTNEKIMAHYMKTNKLMPQFVNKNLDSTKKESY